MKKTLILLLMSIPLMLNAQCGTYTCTNSIAISQVVQNQNFNGDICFTGNGTLNTSHNFNGAVNMIGFNGNQTIQPPLNGVKKMYIALGANVTLSQVAFINKDTIFNNGSLSISQYTSNNSTSNVIVMAPGSPLTVNGVSYSSPAVINNTGNTNNNLVVISCPIALPITLSYFMAEYNTLKWLFTKVDGPISLDSSSDGITWTPVYSQHPIANYEYHYQVQQGWWRINMVDSYSPAINISIHIANSPKYYKLYDMMGKCVGNQDTPIIELPHGVILIKVSSDGTTEKLTIT